MSQAVSIISRYMHDPRKDHWEAVKWVLRYINGTIDVRLVFEKDSTSKQECIGYVDSNYVGDLTNTGLQRVCVYTVSSTSELALYSTVYCCIVYYKG